MGRRKKIVENRSCKYCNTLISNARRGYVCYKCQYDIDKNNIKIKSEERKRLGKVLTKYTEDDCIRWISSVIDRNYNVGVKDLLVDLIDVYYYYGGSNDVIDRLTTSKQLSYMWIFVRKRFDEKYNLEKIDFL